MPGYVSARASQRARVTRRPANSLLSLSLLSQIFLAHLPLLLLPLLLFPLLLPVSFSYTNSVKFSLVYLFVCFSIQLIR